jgi:hypothetical protein
VSTTSSSRNKHIKDKRNRHHSWHQSRSRSRSRSPVKSRRHFGVLPIEYWERTEDCQEAKFLHMEKLDRLCDSREMLVLNTTLHDCHTALEKNMFPCKLQHWNAYLLYRTYITLSFVLQITHQKVWSTTPCGAGLIYHTVRYVNL